MQHLNIFVLFDGLQKGMLSMEREFFFLFPVVILLHHLFLCQITGCVFFYVEREDVTFKGYFISI